MRYRYYLILSLLFAACLTACGDDPSACHERGGEWIKTGEYWQPGQMVNYGDAKNPIWIQSPGHMQSTYGCTVDEP